MWEATEKKLLEIRRSEQIFSCVLRDGVPVAAALWLVSSFLSLMATLLFPSFVLVGAAAQLLGVMVWLLSM